MDEANVDDYVPDVMPGAHNVEPQICQTSPDVPQCSNESFHEGVVHQVQHVAPARDGTVSIPISEQQPTGVVLTDDELQQLNAMSLAASTNKRTEAPDLASIQRDNEVKRELRNARRRASY